MDKEKNISQEPQEETQEVLNNGQADNSSPATNQDNSSHLTQDPLEVVGADMQDEVPQSPSVDIPKNNVPSEEIISRANKNASEPFLDAKIKLTNLYIECELKRLDQQKPLLTSIVSLTKTQIWLFNIVIGLMTFVVVIRCVVCSDISILEDLFDFLKYYVGAILVELLGMLFFVAKSIFSSNYNKIMENVLNTDKQKTKGK